MNITDPFIAIMNTSEHPFISVTYPTKLTRYCDLSIFKKSRRNSEGINSILKCIGYDKNYQLSGEISRHPFLFPNYPN